jgi:hypothetical protein
MDKPTLESLKEDFDRQERELADVMDRLACCDPRDVPQSFFDELDDACEPKLAWSSPVATFSPFGLRG